MRMPDGFAPRVDAEFPVLDARWGALDSFDFSVNEKVDEEFPPLELSRRAKGIVSTDHLPKFEHINAESIEEAVSLLKTYEGRAALIAGGQDLLRELKGRARFAQPQVLVNIKSVKPKLDYIQERATGLTIGSLATLHHIEDSPLVNLRYNVLAQAAHATRALQYRSSATIGGDLCQQVRCWYYRSSRNAFYCLRKGGKECYAVEGDNRYHGIFGSRVCPATCPSDTAPALVALGAKVKIAGALAERTVPVGEFFTPLGNILRPDEVLTEVQIPFLEPGCRSVFMKFGLGNIFGPPIVSVAVVAKLEGKLCSRARVVLGAVSSLPWRAVRAEQVLVGDRIDEGSAESVAQAAVEDASPLSMNAYKVDIVRALVKRAILGIPI